MTGPDCTEPNRYACPRMCREFCNKAEQQKEAAPVTAEFELHCNGEFAASTDGQRDVAWREIQHYAAQYSQDGPITIYEVTRKEVTADQQKEAAPELPPLPKAAVHRATWDGRPGWTQCHDAGVPTEWGDDPPTVVEGFYSADQMHVYGEACRLSSHLSSLSSESGLLDRTVAGAQACPTDLACPATGNACRCGCKGQCVMKAGRTHGVLERVEPIDKPAERVENGDVDRHVTGFRCVCGAPDYRETHLCYA